MSKSRLVVDLSNSPADLKATYANISAAATRRTPRGHTSPTRPDSVLSLQARTTKRRTRSSAASTIASVNGDEELTDDFPPLSVIGFSAGKTGKAALGISRASMSSVSTANDYASSSGYSTPATSAVATPAVPPKEDIGSSLRKPRGRPQAAVTNPLPPSAITALQRARDLRNSKFSLNPVNNKRKRLIVDDEDEDEDQDEDQDTADAQIAKALQAEENAKINRFDSEEAEDVIPRRARRALRAIRPKADYVADFSDDETDVRPGMTKRTTSRPGLRQNGRKSSLPNPKKLKINDSGSDESDFVISDSDDDFSEGVVSRSSPEIPLTLLSASRKPPVQSNAVRTNNTIREQPNSSRNRGASSRWRGSQRGGARLQSSRPGFSMASTIALGETDSKTSATATDATSYLTSEDENGDNPFRSLDLGHPALDVSETDDLSELDDEDLEIDGSGIPLPRATRRFARDYVSRKAGRRAAQDRARLEAHHPELLTMWKKLEDLPAIKTVKAEQPKNISRELKPFQLEGLSWMQAMESTAWGGGLLGDEMGMGKTIQAVSLIMSDYPAKNPSLVLIPPVALMQWQQEIGDYTDGTLKTFVFHGTNKNTKGVSLKELKKFDVILMSYNSLESMFRHQEKGFKRKEEVHFQKSVIHQLHFHRVILDEAHNIKTRTTGVAKACFALKADHKWCLSGTPLQNRIGEFFSLVRFLDIRPFACYFCKQCPCSTLEWTMNADNRCIGCSHSGMQHVSVFNQELLNPIQKHGNKGLGKEAFRKLRLLTDRFMLRRVKRDHSSAMELPAKEIQVDRQFFGEEENDFAASIMNSGTRKFETYVAQGVMLNNYANIFGLIMQMRQVADHPDLILKKNGEGGQNIIVCCICDETAEEAIRSTCRHDFCRSCAKNYLKSSDDSNTQPDCPQCHIPLSIDLEQPEMEQDQQLVKKSSIINRIKMENWTSSSKIEALVHDLHAMRSHNSSSKSIIFSQFTTMLQLVEWRLRRAGITTVMLDGSMTPAQRQASINHFMADVNVECFLVSLKAGGVALNLTEASKVFIVDPWWNPAAEWQSADRCHRIGQCRPCSITRLCIEDSVESRMVLLQEKKANMINSTINADDSAMESLTPEDMQFLFRGN